MTYKLFIIPTTIMAEFYLESPLRETLLQHKEAII